MNTLQSKLFQLKGNLGVCTTLIFFLFSFLTNIQALQAQCANIQFVDLRETPGFPQTDDLNVCGNSDTLSILVFTDDPGDIQGFEMTVNMVAGMRYAGFEDTHYGGCTTISNSDPDVQSPSFIAGGVTCGDIFVANIGVTADCTVDLVSNDYVIEIEYSYTYFPPTGGAFKCKGVTTLDNDFNGAMKVPVLNMFTPSPIDVTVTSLGTPACQNFVISQDGLQAYLNEFKFAVCGLDIGATSTISVASMTANDIDILSTAIYNPVDTSLTACIDDSFFAFNGSPNPLGESDQFDTAERVNFEVCYEVANCPAGADIPFAYKAWYGCFDEVCQVAGQSSFLKVRPTGSLLPTITASLDNGIQICGDDAKVSAMVTNPNTDTDQNVYTDLHIGFQACGMEAFQITDVMINGVSVPPVFEILADDIDIDLSMNTDPAIGLSDYDGDGFFDDLPGGAAPLDVMVFFSLACGAGVDGGCPEINCPNVQFYVSGKTNCGNNFQGFPDTGDFNLQYGQQAVSNVGEDVITGTTMGYNFGQYSNDGAPIAGTNSSEITVEFCYEFGQENIADCPSGGETKMVAYFGGPQIIMADLEVVPGTVEMDDGSGYAPVADALVTLTPTSPAESTLEINAGNNNSTLCYKYNLKLDDCHCGPVQYVAVSQQIVSVCSDCTPDCEIVKGCRETLIAADPQCTPCPCMAQYIPVKTERKNLGYIDKEMTRKITRDELLAANAVDLGRFMPGDTLWHQGYWELLDEDLLGMADPGRWLFAFRMQTLGGSGTSGEIQSALPLTFEGGSIVLNEMRIENPDGSVHIVDISSLPECDVDPTQAATTINSFDTHFQTPWPADPNARPACTTTSWEGYDGNQTTFDMWNFDRMEEVNMINPNVGNRHTYGTGDCLTAFLEAYDLVEGSQIHFDWCVPMVKNPLREMAKILGVAPAEQNAARIVEQFYAYPFDEIAGTSTYGMGPLEAGCQESIPFEMDCPGGIVSETNIVLDNCGGTVEHAFAVEAFAGPPGDEWFVAEYRPLIELHDLELPIYSPLAYCANAQIEQNGTVTPVTVDSTKNMICSPVAGYSDDLCAVDTGAEGAIVIDLYAQGIRGLGIGLDNCDTIKLSYDYCMTCPAPLEGLLDYQLKADWCYPNGTPNECLQGASTFYNPKNDGGASTLGDEANAAGYVDDTWHNVNYYDIFNLDTLYCKVDDTQGIVFIDDSEVTPTAPVTATNADGKDLIAAQSPGSSIEVKEIEFCNPDPMDATGFSGYVKLPNPVMFQGICLDAAGTMPLVTTLISDDGQEKKYQVDFPSDVLASTDCISVFVKTSLLYCPAPGSLPPEICVGASSGCSPAEVRAAIGGGGTCSSSEVCYAYLFGEADLQTEWFSYPEGIDLCETFTLHVRTKNVKDLLLLNLDPSFTLPFGLSVVPGSWDVAYPGGTVDMIGNFGAWTSVPDPDVVSGSDYAWSDDALWSSFIDMNGLKGVSSTLDSNTVAFRFDVTTNCDEFLSGSRPRTETQSSDPCGPEPLSSGDVESPALIVNGADPADHAQVLAVASPSELYCGGLSNTFGITALNISEYATTDSVVTCITIPTDVLTYTPGSVMFTNGFTPAYVTETVIGNTLQVCAHSPVIPVGGSWTMTFEAEMNEDAPCGDIELGADIKSVVEAVSCVPGPPDECAVFVQNSLNPSIFLELKPPLATDDVRVSMDCSMGEDPVQVCYEIDLTNPGPAYSGNVNVAIFDDVTANGVVDSFDGVLNDNDHAVSLAPGESTTIMMCLDVAAIQSCPIIIRQTYETDCACDTEDTPVMNLIPSWFADLGECVVLCPSEPLILETCGDYEIVFDPAGSVTQTDDGMGTLTIQVEDGFDDVGPVTVTLTGTTGECEVMEVRQVKSLGDFMPENQEADICADDCVDLDLMIPDDIIDGATITWTPAIGLDDPTSATPEVCGLTADQTYNVEIAFGAACIFNIEYEVTYNPNGVTTITGEEFCLCQEAGTLTGLPGFDSYEWYSIQSGAEILEVITTTNTWTGPTVAGDYFLKAYLPGAICPNVSNVVTLEGKECVDLELEKNIINIPDPLVLGSQITYEIEVCNIADDDLGLKFDATNIVITDELPGAVTYVQHTQTSGNYSPTANDWMITSLASGTCETLLIDVTIDEPGVIENTVQISESDQEDIDSEENNDDGDQSEDDEDAAQIELICESLGGEIFYDNNDDGCQDTDEGLVMEAINVSLYECGDVPGTDPPAAVTQTVDGIYEFGLDSDDPGADICLQAGTEYFVVFDIPNNTNETLEDYAFSSMDATGACATDGNGDDVDPTTGATGCADPSDTDGNDGDADNHMDAGITPPCYELAGEIFYDDNNDGCQDPGEGLVDDADIEVSLYACGDTPGVDQPLASTTVSDGQYEFGPDSDDPGADYCLENDTEYFVVFDIPNAVGEDLEEYTFSENDASGACAVSGESDNVDPATGASGCYDPDNDDGTDGDDDQNIDAGITPPCETLGGEIFYDTNGNGCEDSSESLVMEPINVMLYECGEMPGVDPPAASTTVTDGEYEFGPDSDDPGAEICLEPGTQYFVVFDIPMGAGEALDGYEFTEGTASASCEAVGESDDVNPATGASGCYDPNDDDGTDGDDDNSIDAGIMPPCESLSGEIFYDYDDNGCQDGMEMPVMMDVNVSLYECGDTPGIDPPAAATTVSDGEYMFGEGSDDPGADICLEAGTEYFVVFDIPNAPGEDLEGYEFSSGTADPACALSGDSDDVDPSTGESGCYDPADDGSDGDTDNNIDAGITPPCESLSGEIFYDDDMDGCEDSDESLVTEVIGVTLYECGQTPGVDTPTASTFTNDGMYEFGPDSDDPGADVCLMPGTQYFIVFDIPNGAGQALEDYMITMGMADAGCEALGESNVVDPTTGQSDCYDPNDNDSGDGDGDSNVDAGITPPCESLGGEIFYDDSRDGCEDPGESLVMEAINVTLYECGDVPGVTPPVATTTVTDGEYEFGLDSDDPGADVCLEGGTSYFVVFDIPNAAGEALEDYSFSEGTADPACAASGEADDVDPASGATGCNDPADDDGLDGDGDNSMNAGITPPCESLGGEIFYDGNDDGCQDANEMLVMEAIDVTLYECGQTPGVDTPTASTTVTDGQYEFGEDSDDPGADVCLEAGTQYFVVFDIPNAIGEALEEYEFSSGMADPACEASGDSNDVDPTSGESTCHDPVDDDAGDGDGDNNIDAGIVPPCEQLGGEIFYDLDENGCQDMGESLVMEDINVSLYECGDDPTVDPPVATTSVSDGMYAFGETSDDPGADICLEAGTEYFVVFDIPNAAGDPLEGFEFTEAPLNPTCAAAGDSDDVNPTTGQSGCFDPNNEDGEDGDADENIDAGIVPPCEEMAGEIFIDEDGNGCQDPGEDLAMTNVTVSLYECGDTPGVDLPAAITMVTDGMYEFGEDSDDPGADICLAPNVQYFVHFDIPNAIGEPLEEYSFSEEEADPACEASGQSDDVDPATGSSECYDPSGDDDDGNVDAGITPPCESFGGEIFVDENRDGCEDPGESLAMFDIEVSLYECGDIPGVDQPIAATTVSDGEYEFGEDSDDPGADICLEAGTEYFVAFDIPNGPGEDAEDYEFTDGVASGACAVAGESDNVDPATGTSGCYDPDNDDGGDGDGDNNIDAGIMPPCENLGGEIFYDDNANGCQDGGESLVMESINVMLYECGQTPGVDTPVAETNVADGMYEFGEDSDDPGADVCLEAGTEYFVVFDIPMGANEVLDGYDFTEGMVSTTCMGAGQSDDVDPTNGQSGCYDPNDDDGADGSGDNNIDAGITAPCESIAGEIFYDDNMDGCQDTGESLVMEDIEVSIYECGSTPGLDQPFASTVVSDGMYEFGPESDDADADVCLQAGTEYFVVFDIPNAVGEALEDYEFTPGVGSGACDAAGQSDNVDPATGQSACVDPDDNDGSDGDDDENVDAGIIPPCESLGGEIFYDGNENGCQDDPEGLVMEIINVTLYECGQTPGVDTPVASTTVTDGMYEFGPESDDPGADICLDPGTQYFVLFDIPMGAGEVLDGFEFTEGTASASCENAGLSDDVDPTSGMSGCFDPNDEDGTDGDSDSNIDVGITPPCEQLGGEIFYDDNNNGCQDADEPLVDDQDIEVVLYQCGDVPGLDQPAAFTTVSDGMYLFGEASDDPGADICLDAEEEYFVMFHIPNAPGEALEDYYFSENIASPGCLFSGEGDNVDPNTGESSCHNPSDDDSDDGDADENIDAGIVHPCEILGGEIFLDYDNDGCQDDTESLVTDAVNVTLFECGDDPTTATPVASTTTTDGTYQFGDEYSLDSTDDPCLNPRLEYFVVFDFPSAAGDPLEDHYFSDGEADATCTAAGGSDDVDSDSGESGCYSPDNDDDDMNIDAGITPCEEISGEVFYDWNANGCQDDATETPVEGVDVYIFECGEMNPSPANALASTSTNADGEYAFGPEEEGTAEICLHPDTEYFVMFDIPSGDGELLEDFYPTDGDGEDCVGADTADDTDPTTGTTECHDPDDDDDDDDLDMGITPCEEIAGEVFYDNNADGCQDDATEGPVPGVDVYVYECGETDLSPANALASDTTDDNGEYGFGPEEEGDANICLDPMKTYFVVFDVPNATGESLDDFALTSGDGASCSGGDNANDVDPTTGESACYDPDGDDDDDSINAGIMPCEDLGGTVFYDDNEDGCQDPASEQGAPGVDVYLFECGETDTSPANALASDTTDEDGEYLFGSGEDGDADICLDADVNYFVVFDLPNATGESLQGYEFTEGDAMTCTGTADSNDIGPATGASDCYDPEDDDATDGDDDQNVDAGIMKPVDAALNKTLATGGPHSYGDVLTFEVTVFNQGSVDLYNVKVNDFLPCGFEYLPANDALWSYDAVTGIATHTVEGPITGGSFEVIPMQVTLIGCDPVASDSYTNIAEIESFQNEDGEDITSEDVDSMGDDNPTNDTAVDDDVDNTDGDEDDNDFETIEVVDLALIKTVEPSGPYFVGDKVEFEITVCNQGSIPMYNVEVTDYLGAALVLDATSPTNANWVSLDPSTAVYRSITGPLMPSACITIPILVDLISLNPSDMINEAEISQMEDADGELREDIDSTVDGIFGNDPHGDDDQLDGNGTDDEDDHDQALIFSCPETLACTNINVSLDENCEVMITGGMMTTDSNYPNDSFEITIEDEYGNPVPNPVGQEYLGQTLNITVSMPNCPDVAPCWATATIEDKILPVLELEDCTVSCNAIYLADGTPEIPEVDADNCGGAEVIWLGDVPLPEYDCEDPAFEGFSGVLIRSFAVVDAAMNTDGAVYTKLVYVERPDLTGVEFPDAIEVECTGDDTDISPAVTGFPTLGGNPLFPNVPDELCHVFLTYTDSDPIETQCNDFVVIRTWKLVEWFCGAEYSIPTGFPQYITVTDNAGPVLTPLPDVTVSTVKDCSVDYALPIIEATDACNNVESYLINTGVNPVYTNNGETVTFTHDGMNVDGTTYTVEYVVTDECHNSSTESFDLTVIDDKGPIAICEFETQVTLSNGVAHIYAETFDDGSFDGCGHVDFAVRRMNDNCNNPDNLVFGDHVEFCCADKGTEQMVVFQVTDKAGNSNICMVTVIIKDPQATTFIVPDDITLSEEECAMIDPTDIMEFGDVIVESTDGCGCSDISCVTFEDGPSVLECNVEIFTRSYTFTDPDTGETTTLSHTVTCEGAGFDFNDIDYPDALLEYTSNVLAGCGADLTPEGLMSEPVLNAGPLDQLAINFTDVVFDPVPEAGDDFYSKIVRTFVVLDWCETGGDELVADTFVQTIKLMNSPFDLCSSDAISLDLDASCQVTVPAPFTEYPGCVNYTVPGGIPTPLISGTEVTLSLLEGTQVVTWTAIDFNDVTVTCTTTVEVNDPLNACPLQPGAGRQIQGDIYTENGVQIPNVEVGLVNTIDQVLSQQNGHYDFGLMPNGGSYIIEPNYDLNHRNGVSTLDILIIQRHLLNLQPLTSPYQHIAADADKNGLISASDLVDIRKVVLELIDEFPSNTSWRFVDFEQEFIDPNAPLNESIDEQYMIPVLNTHMDIDFIGVKIGDVNNSVIMDADQSSTEVRGTPLTIGYSKSSKGFDITTTTGVSFNGIQTTLVFDQEVTGIESSLPGFGEDQYVIDGNTVKISYTASGATLDLVANQALFEVSTSSKTMDLSSEGLRSEVYTGNGQIEVQPIVLENKNDKLIAQMSNQPNPWSQSTQLVILTPVASDISITFTNELGQVIYVLETTVVKGINKIQVTNDILQTNGMIYYKTNIGPQQINGSMMIIE